MRTRLCGVVVGAKQIHKLAVLLMQGVEIGILGMRLLCECQGGLCTTRALLRARLFVVLCSRFRTYQHVWHQAGIIDPVRHRLYTLLSQSETHTGSGNQVCWEPEDRLLPSSTSTCNLCEPITVHVRCRRWSAHLYASGIQDGSALNELGKLVNLKAEPVTTINQFCYPLWRSLAL